MYTTCCARNLPVIVTWNLQSSRLFQHMTKITADFKIATFIRQQHVKNENISLT